MAQVASKASSSRIAIDLYRAAQKAPCVPSSWLACRASGSLSDFMNQPGRPAVARLLTNWWSESLDWIHWSIERTGLRSGPRGGNSLAQRRSTSRLLQRLAWRIGHELHQIEDGRIGRVIVGRLGGRSGGSPLLSPRRLHSVLYPVRGNGTEPSGKRVPRWCAKRVKIPHGQNQRLLQHVCHADRRLQRCGQLLDDLPAQRGAMGDQRLLQRGLISRHARWRHSSS